MQANAAIEQIGEAREQSQRDFNLQEYQANNALKEKRTIMDEDQKEMQRASGKRRDKADAGLNMLDSQTSLARQTRNRDINEAMRKQRLADMEDL
jgi:hypothetical protein